MKRIFFFAFLLMANYTFSQADSLQKEINEQVWKPFIKAFESYDTDAFMAVHSKDVTRVIQDGNMVQNFEQYQFENRRNDTRNKTSKRNRKIELRFIQRIAANGRAFEVGYFKTSTITPDGVSRSFYGKFHVLLRKEGGAWKILMDADTSSENDQAAFDAALPMDK